MMLDLSKIDKKVREAHFFLHKVKERAEMAFGEHEEFDFYLSALLSAGASVLGYLSRVQTLGWKPFYEKWRSTLTEDDLSLMRFLYEDRRVEVHEGGSRRTPVESPIPVSDFYTDASGSVYVYALPGSRQPRSSN